MRDVQSKTMLQVQLNDLPQPMDKLGMVMKVEMKEEVDETELEGCEKSEATTPDSKSDSRQDESEEYEQLFAAVMTARDGDRNISEIFQLLPSRAVSSGTSALVMVCLLEMVCLVKCRFIVYSIMFLLLL